jgi:predicted transcriptional regulator
MYKANLSFTLLNDYIDFLLSNNLIMQTGSEGKEVYFITAKGVDFLQRHNELVRLLKA